VGDVVLQWLVSASTCICAQSNREVHRASTSDGISGGQPNRVQPRRTAQKKTTSQFTSSCFGLVHGSGKWHKEHALSNHAKSEPSRVGRDWPVMSTTRVLIVGQSRCLRHEVILFRDARGPRSRNSVVFDGGFVIAHPFK
jgi:hypothetical protein